MSAMSDPFSVASRPPSRDLSRNQEIPGQARDGSLQEVPCHD